MALTCGFYNSVDGDRKYDATQFASLFDGVITDGVVAAVGDFFATTPGGGMVVNVGSGRAWFDRTWTYSDAKIPITLDASDLLYDRIDAVVLEIDTSIAIRDNSIKVVKGTPAQEPQKPALINEGDVHQYALAYVRVKASSIEVGAGDITINVGRADCPFVTSIVETPELEVLFAQWDAQFTEWFENVQSQLEGDIAANLQRQIDLKANKVDIGNFQTPATKLGLTGDLSVGASLGVLATAGDLHVWSRTKSGTVDYPVSTKENAYTPGTSGGTTIEYLGRLGGASHFYSGWYSGSSSAVPSRRTINLGFKPKAVLVYCRTQDGFDDGGGRYPGGLAIDGFPTRNETIKVVSNGFQVKNTAAYDGTNLNGREYCYVAWR